MSGVSSFHFNPKLIDLGPSLAFAALWEASTSSFSWSSLDESVADRSILCLVLAFTLTANAMLAPIQARGFTNSHVPI